LGRSRQFRAVAFPGAAGFNQRVQPSDRPSFADSAFTPVRFGLLLALLIAAAFPQVISGLETLVARDYGFFAYPLAHFQKECFLRGELPFWNPYNNCGVPFLAQWNTLPLYPPALLYLCLPLTWALSFFCLVHLWWAGFGMYWLARRWTGSGFAAAFAGTAFAFNGLTLNLLMWPSHIATFSWLPWVVLTAESAWRDGGKKLPLAAFAGSLQMLAGGPETIAFTWLIVSALWLQQFSLSGAPRVAMVWRYALVGVLVLALSAAQLLPFLDLAAHAQRAPGYTDLRWSLPASGWANFFVPMAFGSTAVEGIFFQHGQYWTSSYYPGICALWLALLALAGWRASRLPPGMPVRVFNLARLRKWCSEPASLLAVLATLALLCALGEHTPFYPLLRRIIPPLSLVTYPVKFIMVVVFAIPLLAAMALARLASSQPRLLPLGGVLLSLIGAIVVWTQVAPTTGDKASAALLNGLIRAVFLIVTGALLWSLKLKKPSPWRRYLPWLLILAAWLDVLTHEPPQNPTVSPGVYALNLARTRLAMHPQPELGGSRAMLSPAAALELNHFGAHDPKDNFLAKRIGYCADVNLLDAVPKVDGFFSLAPREFDGLLSQLYSATKQDWTGLQSFLGVAQYSSPTNPLAWQPRSHFLPLVTGGQQPVFLEPAPTVAALAVPDFDPAKTVFLPPAAKTNLAGLTLTTVSIINPQFTDDTVDFTADAAAPSIAVVAQTYYHDWEAEIDGHPVPLLCANAAFQAVALPAGTHQVHLFYHDRAFAAGAAIAICLWINCGVSYLALRRRDLPASPGPANGDYF
jgi:hypothetical protein